MWSKHIFAKRKQLGRQLRKMCWLLGSNAQLNLTSKLLFYKAKTHLALWNPAVEYSIPLEHRNHSKIPIKDAKNNNSCTMVRDKRYLTSLSEHSHGGGGD